MAYQNLLFETEDSIAVITINQENEGGKLNDKFICE